MADKALRKLATLRTAKMKQSSGVQFSEKERKSLEQTALLKTLKKSSGVQYSDKERKAFGGY